MRLGRSLRNGLICCLSFAIVAGLLASAFFQNMENRVFDAHMRSHQLLVNEDIVLITVDDYSVEKISEWPISSDLIAKTFDYIIQGNPSILVSTNQLAQFAQDDSTGVLLDMQEEINLRKALLESNGNSSDPVLNLLQEKMDDILALVDDEQKQITNIAQSNKLILPLQLHPIDADSHSLDVPDNQLPKILIQNFTASDFELNEQAYKLKLPISEIMHVPASIGHVNKTPSSDGVVRKEKFFWPLGDKLIPSLALRTHLQHTVNTEDRFQNNPVFLPTQLTTGPQGQLQLADRSLNFPDTGNLYTRFYSGQRSDLFEQYSFYDVFTESIPDKSFENKIVLFGLTAAGITPRVKVSSGQNLAPVEYLAHASSSMLNDDWVRRGNNQRITEVVIYLLIAIYVVFIAHRLKLLTNIILTVSTALMLLVFEFGSLEFSYWYKLVTPMFFLLWCMILLSIINLRQRESNYARLGLERNETNLQLGLAFQNQGALDLAFEKFLACTPDNKMLAPLYNLGIEYERKRQFAKASTVYEHLMKIDAEHLDVPKRLHQTKTMAMNSTQQSFDTGSRLTSLLHSNADIEKPRLGRYELEREIGRGAMSIVYAGKDPTINRTVAIKVQNFSGDDQKVIAKMRARFLTEAKTAGLLNHPDIITIYDIGEETDLIYIAMEYLNGESLESRIKNDQLDNLTIMDISIRMAKALDYAHENKVVHRDVKPSNIIYDSKENTVHLTDFGIARLQDAHLTQTGQVLGTPSYMSPEQITGKRVDHRTDLFSLGATIYQLFTGKLPFQADTMATLLYKITMEDPIPFDAIRPDLPDELARIISKLLQKDPDDRYQTASELAKALEDCKNSLKNTT